MRSILFVALALIATLLLVGSSTAANAQFVSCAISEVTIASTSGSVIYTRDSFSTTPTYTVTLNSAIPSSVVVTETIADTNLAAGRIRIYLNTVKVATTSAPTPDPETITGLLTGPGETNTIRVRSDMSYDDGEYFAETCDYSYVFIFTNPSSIVGDPQFSGLRGQSFQVHGIDGAVYALISAPEYQINSRFQFLDGPRPCPVMPSTGVQSKTCWSHPGSYLGAVGLITSSGQAIEMLSGAATEGFASLTVNDREIAVGDSIEVTGVNGVLGSLIRNSTHEATLTVGSFSIVLESIDMFVNLRSVRVLFGEWRTVASQRVHGLLGQTWQSRHYPGSVKEIEGEVDDYVVEEDSLTGHSFVFNRFGVTASA